MHASGARFPDLGRNLRGILHAPVSWTWAAGLIAVQLLVAMRGGAGELRWWFENFGLSRDGFLAGKVWQIFTHALLHGGWWHVALNALFLLLAGSRVEHVAGRAVMSRCILYGILGGGIGHLMLGTGLLAGISGGCFALVLLLATLSPESRLLPIPVSGRSLGVGLLLAALLLALANPELGIPGLAAAGRAIVNHGMGSWFEVGHACHLGGGLAGWLHGRWILRPRVSLARLQRDRARRENR